MQEFLSVFILDPNFIGKVPILDGGEGGSEHILYGTNVDWEKKKNIEEMSSEPTAPVEAKNSLNESSPERQEF